MKGREFFRQSLAEQPVAAKSGPHQLAEDTHFKVGITLDLYSHVMLGMQEHAVAKVHATLQAAQKRR